MSKVEKNFTQKEAEQWPLQIARMQIVKGFYRKNTGITKKTNT